jgi:DNA polymerase-3 subunit delta'
MSAFLVGQDRVERALTNALGKNRLAHGLLFAGPPGSGRERAARGLAASLMCERRVVPFGCQECRGCKRAMSGNHPDVHVLMPEAEAVRRGLAQPDGKKKPSQDILVDAVRELVGRMHLAPFEGGARVAIVVDAHRMNVNAQNALLKTLEEPAARTFLILVVPHERTVLPTIGSRCLRLLFTPPPAQELAIEGPGAPLLSAMLHGSAEERLDAAEALGKERSDVDAALADLEQRLIDSARRDTAPGWQKAASLLQRVADARDAIGQNASVQLCLEELLLV